MWNYDCTILTGSSKGGKLVQAPGLALGQGQVNRLDKWIGASHWGMLVFFSSPSSCSSSPNQGQVSVTSLVCQWTSTLLLTWTSKAQSREANLLKPSPQNTHIRFLLWQRVTTTYIHMYDICILCVCCKQHRATTLPTSPHPFCNYNGIGTKIGRHFCNLIIWKI